MTAYVPPGWPAGVHPPGSEDFERTAVAWLLDVVPADYRLYGVLRRYPLALAALATHHANACVAGAREGYRTARTELGDALPAHGLDSVLAAYRAEGRRLVAIARAVDLVTRALRGEVFTPQLADAANQNPATSKTPASQRGGDGEAGGAPEASGKTEPASQRGGDAEAGGKTEPARRKYANGKQARDAKVTVPPNDQPARRKDPNGKQARDAKVTVPPNDQPARRAS